MRIFALTLIFILVSACATKPPWEKIDKQQQLEVYTKKGRGYLDIGQAEKALQDFRKALAIKANYHPAQHGTALALEQQGELALAESFFKKALKDKTIATEVRHDLAGFYYRQQRFKEAQAELEKASQDIYFAQRGLVFINLGYTHIKLNQFNSAISSFNQAIKLRTAIDLAQNELLKLYVATENWQAAEATWLILRKFDSYEVDNLALALEAVTKTNNQQEAAYITELLSTKTN